MTYGCSLNTNINITSPETAEIGNFNGVHLSGKSNNDEISLTIADKHIEYFPRGLEKIFTNLIGIAVKSSKLKEVHQDDLKHFTNLKLIKFEKNNIQVIEDGLFNHQSDIESIVIQEPNIVQISPTVFDNLSKLSTLELDGNKCINMHAKKNRTNVLEVIKSMKIACLNVTKAPITTTKSPLMIDMQDLDRLLADVDEMVNRTFNDNLDETVYKPSVSSATLQYSMMILVIGVFGFVQVLISIII